jgi:hypothetical protein
MRTVLAALLTLLWAAPFSQAQTPDLSKVDRTVAKEPVYQSKAPKYCLLVFGAEARNRVWLVIDGDRLIFDRKSTGDLTDAEKVARKGRSFSEMGALNVGDAQTAYELYFVVSAGGTVENDYYAVTIRQGERRFKIGFCRFADTPGEAPVLWFDGPLAMGIADPDQGSAPESRPSGGQDAAAAPVLAPLDLLLKASGEVRKLRSAAGKAVFEGYALDGKEKPEPHTKGKVNVYFDGGKYHLRYKYDYRQRRAVAAKEGGGKQTAEMTPEDVAVICDGAVTQEVIYSAFWFRPAGCVVNLRDRLRDASWGIALDHPAELWRQVLDVEALLKDVGRDAVTLTQLESGTIRGFYRAKNAPKVRAEFEARPADGYNVSTLRVFNDGETQPAQTAQATWARAKGAWYVKELVTELDGRRPAGDGKLNRLVFRYESFEPGAKVDAKLFSLDCLRIPADTRTVDQREGGNR